MILREATVWIQFTLQPRDKSIAKSYIGFSSIGCAGVGFKSLLGRKVGGWTTPPLRVAGLLRKPLSEMKRPDLRPRRGKRSEQARTGL